MGQGKWTALQGARLQTRRQFLIARPWWREEESGPRKKFAEGLPVGRLWEDFFDLFCQQ